MLVEGDNCDGVIIGVAQPTHACTWLDADTGPGNVEVVPFAGPHQCAVRAEFHGLTIKVLSIVKDTHALHAAGPFLITRRGRQLSRIAMKHKFESREAPERLHLA